MYLGIDIGGTSVRIGAFTQLTDTEPIDKASFKVTKDYEADFGRLRGSCQLFHEHSDGIAGIGVAIAGVLDKRRTTLERGGNTPQWVGRQFVAELSNTFGCPVVLGNDAEAAGMAEAVYGNPDGEDFWLVIWGTGVGGTLVRYSDGQPFVFAGELGHMRITEFDDRKCNCGQFGCLEAYCGGDKILEHVGTPAEKLDAAQWREVLKMMATGLRNAVTAQPVGRVFFSGGIAANQQQYIPALENMLHGELRIVGVPKMALSRFGESAGTVGALAMLKSSLV